MTTEIKKNLCHTVTDAGTLIGSLRHLHQAACNDDGNINILSIMTRDLIDQACQIKDRLSEIQSLLNAK